MSAAVGGILQRCWRLICGIDRRRSAQVAFDSDSDFDLDLWRVRELFDSVLVFIIFIAPHWVEELTESVAPPLATLPPPLQLLFICSHPSLLLRAGSSFCLRVFRVVHLTFRRANRSSHLGIILIDFQSERGLSLSPLRRPLARTGLAF